MGQWQIVFFIAAIIYIACATFYNVFGSGDRQPWDNPMNDEPTAAVPIHTVNGVQNSQSNGHQMTTTTTPHSQQQTQLNGNGVLDTKQ